MPMTIDQIGRALAAWSELPEDFEGDAHVYAAAKAFGVPFGDVTPDQRQMSKEATFAARLKVSSMGSTPTENTRLLLLWAQNFPALYTFVERADEWRHG